MNKRMSEPDRRVVRVLQRICHGALHNAAWVYNV
jgi:hypothetical protein